MNYSCQHVKSLVSSQVNEIKTVSRTPWWYSPTHISSLPVVPRAPIHLSVRRSLLKRGLDKENELPWFSRRRCESVAIVAGVTDFCRGGNRVDRIARTLYDYPVRKRLFGPVKYSVPRAVVGRWCSVSCRRPNVILIQDNTQLPSCGHPTMAETLHC